MRTPSPQDCWDRLSGNYANPAVKVSHLAGAGYFRHGGELFLGIGLSWLVQKCARLGRIRSTGRRAARRCRIRPRSPNESPAAIRSDRSLTLLNPARGRGPFHSQFVYDEQFAHRAIIRFRWIELTTETTKRSRRGTPNWLRGGVIQGSRLSHLNQGNIWEGVLNVILERPQSGSHHGSRTEDARKTRVRSRLIRLLSEFPQRLVWAVFVLCMGFVSIAILSAVAMVSHTPFVFPSLGPTAILFFFHPMAASASPRHALYGHAIGILCGYGSLYLMGLQHAGSAMNEAVGVHRLFAVALSLAATAFFMVLLKVAHAPAGATTLIVSLGIITRPWHLVVVEIAVALLCLQAICFNRLAGLKYPLWVGPVDSAMEELRTGGRLEERKEKIRPNQ
jgi:CBS domain-containing membrane protein